MPLTPLQAITRQAQLRPEATAFIFRDEVWTYGRFAEQSERVAHGLVANGVKPGDRVALHMLNRPEFIVTYYACYRLGAIAAPLRSAFTFAELNPLLQRLQPTLYIGEKSLYPNVADADAALLPPSRRILIDVSTDQRGGLAWDTLQQAPIVDLPTPPIDEPTLLINTSGTTGGQPKFITHTPGSIAAIADLMGKHGGFRADDVSASSLALGHAGGVFRSLSLFQLGASLVLLDGFDADAVLDAVERYCGTCLSGFPAQYAALIRAQQARPRDLSSLRFGTVAGDTCPIELQEKATAVLGAPIRNSWGSTETSGHLTVGRKPGPVTHIADGAEIRLINDAGADVADGEIGELLVRGPNVFAGYWDDPAATAQALKEGWFHTGDMMRRGDGDEIWFVGRKKDIIIRGGTNISPIEIEDALVASHPAIKEAVVVGKSDAVLGQRVFAFVKLAGQAKMPAMSEILDRIGQRLAAYKVPEDLILLDDLPRNSASKVDRVRLKAMLDERELAPGE